MSYRILGQIRQAELELNEAVIKLEEGGARPAKSCVARATDHLLQLLREWQITEE